jgi:hypothetical protein
MLLDVRAILLAIVANSLHWPPKSPNSGGLLMLNSTRLEAECNDEEANRMLEVKVLLKSLRVECLKILAKTRLDAFKIGFCP